MEVISAWGLPSAEAEGAETFSVRMSLYYAKSMAMFGRTWESQQVPWQNSDSGLVDLAIAQTAALHTNLVGTDVQIVVEIVRGKISLGWAVVPLFPPPGSGIFSVQHLCAIQERNFLCA